MFNKITNIFALAACVFAASSINAARADAPWFAEIPRTPGTTQCYTTGISGDGKTVVGYCTTPTTQTAYRWSQDTGTLPFTADIAVAAGASYDGSVIAGTASVKAMRWTLATGPMSLGAIPSTAQSKAVGVSGDGSVIVGLGNSNAGNGFIWTAQTGMSLLPLLPGSAHTNPRGISSDGQVVAGMAIVSGRRLATRWTAADGITSLGALSPTGISDAAAISGDGSTIVGQSNNFPFRWSQSTGMLAIPGSYSSATANAVSYDGSTIVGTANSIAGQKAFLWTPQEGFRSVSQILGPILPPTWTLLSTTGVSADGLTITGFGEFGGQTRAWAAHIPEPGTATLLGATTIALISRQSRKRRKAAGTL